MNEFDIITAYFTKPAKHNAVSLSTGDDAALLKIPNKHELAISTDTLNVGVHFLHDTAAEDIGYKSLAVNLSDIAAMGAKPFAACLALSVPKPNETWLSRFAHGFWQLADEHNIDLIGGDVTRGPLAITITALGLIQQNCALQRDAAKVDDDIYISGQLGAAALALQQLQSNPNQNINPECLAKLNRPTPRIALGQELVGIANAAIDISDGLLQDLHHILKASQLGATIYVEHISTCSELHSLQQLEHYQLALASGDDYELCFTAPKNKAHHIASISKKLNIPISKIGYTTKDLAFIILDKDSKPMKLPQLGYLGLTS